MRPVAEWTQTEIDDEFARGMMIVSRLAHGVPVCVDSVILDRAAEAFRAAEPSAQARRHRRRAARAPSA